MLTIADAVAGGPGPWTAAWDHLIAFAKACGPWAVPFVFAVGFIKSIPVAALLIPSTTLFVAIAGVHSAAGGTFLSLWLAAAIGATTGDVICYAFGRHYQNRVGNIWPVSLAPELLPKGAVVFNRWGLWSVLGAKFIYGLRPFIPLAAGIYMMPVPLFLSATSLSSMVWAGIGISAGFGFWKLWS